MDNNNRGNTQRDRFIETARAIGADEDMEAFRAKLGVIARQKPKEDGAEVDAAGLDNDR